MSFVSPKTLNAPGGEAKWNIEAEGKQNSFFHVGPVIKCFVKNRKTANKSFA